MASEDEALPTHRGHLAVVTGAAQGIGQYLCSTLAARGADVVGVDLIDLAETAALVRGAGARWLGAVADVTDAVAIAAVGERVRDELGDPDILVNNAATYDPMRWDELDYERWRMVLDVGLNGAFVMCKEFVPGMRRRRWGRIVNIATGVVMNPMPKFVAYRAAKMGLIGFSRGLATELGNDGITVNAVSPGATKTATSSRVLGDAALAVAATSRAIQRMAQPRDVAGAVLFATSEDCALVTGQTIMANGGAYFL